MEKKVLVGGELYKLLSKEGKMFAYEMHPDGKLQLIEEAKLHR